MINDSKLFIISNVFNSHLILARHNNLFQVRGQDDFNQQFKITISREKLRDIRNEINIQLQHLEEEEIKNASILQKLS